LLVELVGSDLGCVEGEIGKLVAFVGGKGTIDSAAVEEVCAALAEAEVWGLTDAIVGGRAGEAFGVVCRLLEEGQEPFRILGMIDWQFRQLLTLQQALHEGLSPYEAGVRMPRFKMEACVRALKSRPLRADEVLGQLVLASREMRGHAAGSRHVLEAFVLRLVTAS
jgi:DNA polymerase III delta subunit